MKKNKKHTLQESYYVFALKVALKKMSNEEVEMVYNIVSVEHSKRCDKLIEAKNNDK